MADAIQNEQFAFIVSCQDETSTRHGAQRFIEWAKQSGEEKRIADRAGSRARIVAAIAKEVENQTGGNRDRSGGRRKRSNVTKRRRP